MNTQAARQQSTINSDDLLVVIGATGKTGRRVVDQLLAKGAALRAVSRSTTPAFDWADRSTWAAALDGAASVYITYQPDLIVDGATTDIEALVAAAEAAGVSRLVLLAGRGEAEARAAGAVVHASTIDSTVLYCAWFNQNFTEGPFAPEIDFGTLTVPIGDVGEPFIDADDIAEVAVAALLEVDADGANPHAGQDYDLTGPRLLTFAEAAAALGQARGTTVDTATVTPEDYRAILGNAGLPDAEGDLILTLFTTLFDGRNEQVATDVERILGRPATDFGDFAARVGAASAGHK